MSIRDRQIRNATEKIIEEELKSGRYPNPDKLRHRLRKFLQENTPGFPSMKLRYWPYRGVSDPDDFNKLQEEVYDDISNLYAEDAHQTLKLLQTFDYSEMERQRIFHELRIIEARTKEMLMKVSEAEGYLTSFAETFDDYSKIDTSRTTCSINFRHNFAYLPSGTQAHRKIHLRDKGIKFSYRTPDETGDNAIIESKEVLPIENALEDAHNSCWIQEVIHDPEQGDISRLDGIVTIDLKEPTSVNSISIEIESPKPLQIEVKYSNNGESYYSIPGTSARKIVYETAWLFPEIEARFIKIVMSKWEEDNREEGLHSYIFGIKTITMERTAYADKGVLYSKPFELPADSSLLVLHTSEELPEQTSIQYSIGLTSGYEFPEHWNEIKPMRFASDNNFFRLQDVDKHEVTFSSTTKGKTVNGIQFYESAALKGKKFIPKSVRLFRGYQQWYVRACVMDGSYTNGDNSELHYPSPNDWMQVDENVPIEKRFINLSSNNTLNFSSLSTSKNKKTAYRYTTHVYCPEARSIGLLSNTINNLNAAIYLNGSQAYKSDDERLEVVMLKKGWNTIDVFLFQINDNAPSFQLPFDLYTVVDDYKLFTVGIQDGMTLVDPYVLQYNTPASVKNRFALEKDGTILFNYDTGQENFALSYQSVDGLSQRYATLRIDMRREPGFNTITPKLNDYRLRVI